MNCSRVTTLPPPSVSESLISESVTSESPVYGNPHPSRGVTDTSYQDHAPACLASISISHRYPSCWSLTDISESLVSYRYPSRWSVNDIRVAGQIDTTSKLIHSSRIRIRVTQRSERERERERKRERQREREKERKRE